MPAGPVLVGGWEGDARTGHQLTWPAPWSSSGEEPRARAGVPTLPVTLQDLGQLPSPFWALFPQVKI